jgi:signal peptidase I
MSRRRRQLVLGTGLLALASVVGATFFLVAFRRYRPPSEAMAPTIRPGDTIWARPASSSRHRGDIMVFTTPRPVGILARPHEVISRVVAVGGDTVEAVGGKLIVNGKPVAEPYVAPGLRTPNIGSTHVPPGTIYVLGDNRENTLASQVYGPVPFANIKARVVRLRAPSSALVFGVAGLLCLPFVIAAGTVQLRPPHSPSKRAT